MKRLSLFSLALIFIFALIPASLAFADAGTAKISTFDPDVSKANTPVTVFFGTNGNVSDVHYGVPGGFKVDVLKEGAPKSTGLHTDSFDLWDTQRSWRDEDHTAHYLDYGQRQANWCSWSPDGALANFVGVYNVLGDYAVGLVNPSSNNVFVTIGSAGYYTPQAFYFGSRESSSPVHFQYSYYPWW